MSTEEAEISTSAYQNFINKLSEDDTLSYLLDEYPELIKAFSVFCLSRLPKINIEHAPYVDRGHV
mgnify:CR=1 FL=1|jgi:hypothetical protein